MRLFTRTVLGVTLILMLTAVLGCSNSQSETLTRMLLSADDFPTLNLSTKGVEIGDTTGPMAAGQVGLEGPDIKILESIVLFDAKEPALEILDGIKRDLIAQGASSPDVEGFQGISGVDTTTALNGAPASTLFFVEGTSLVRITVTGGSGISRILEFAETARNKVSQY